MSEPAKKQDPSVGHRKVTGLSGNEIFCLNKLRMTPGNLCIGNSVFSLGLKGGITAGLNILGGGEIPEITQLIHDGRTKALDRMLEEANESSGSGVTGVSTEIVSHSGNIEFLSIGSVIHQEGQEQKLFSTSADAQELYCQHDAGFQPVHFVFGNVAYSIGVGGNIGGFMNSLSRGEVAQYTEIFDTTRHLALSRISQEAKKFGANSVIGINTTITPFMGAQEMLMIGTASNHKALHNFSENPVTSDLTNQELWNLVNMGYLPLRLVMGVSVYSLGLAGGLKAGFQSLARGEIGNLTELIYEAREKALDRIEKEADRWRADEVVGVKTYVYDLGGGLVEFLAIGTAVKKVAGVTTASEQLLPQAIIKDEDTYFESGMGGMGLSLSSRGKSSAPLAQKGPIALIGGVMLIAFYVLVFILKVIAHK